MGSEVGMPRGVRHSDCSLPTLRNKLQHLLRIIQSRISRGEFLQSQVVSISGCIENIWQRLDEDCGRRHRSHHQRIEQIRPMAFDTNL